MTLIARLRPMLLLSLLSLGACGFAQPGTPGHEPPGASARYNPISHEQNASGR